MKVTQKLAGVLPVYSRETLAKNRDKATFKENFKLLDHLRLSEAGNGQTIAEFVGTDDFDSVWYQRQRYEVEAGRDEEPQLWQPIYSLVRDPSLPRLVPVQQLGPGGVIFNEIQEGGEVKFSTVGESSYSVPIKHYGTGFEYTKDLVIFNELWRLSIVERQAGIAHNALMNEIHLSPIIDYNYTAANQTAAHVDSDMNRAELWLATIEDAIVNSRTDSTNPRRGPYDLLVAPADLFAIEAALERRRQDGLPFRSSAINAIRNVIAYDGWTGTRGNKEVTYDGVTSGTAYLINRQYQGQDFQSFMKQDLQPTSGNADVSRFILEQVVWDFYHGVYSNPSAAVEEITWPS